MIVPQAAEFVTQHGDFPGICEPGRHLRDIARNHHGVHISVWRMHTMKHIGTGNAEGDGGVGRNLHPLRVKTVACSYHGYGVAAIPVVFNA